VSRNLGGEVWGEAAPCWWLELCICIPIQDSGIDIGDISARKALRKQLQCKTFRWYLVSVYPEMRMYSDIVAYGVLQNSLKTDLCLDQGPDTENVPIVYICHGMTPQNVYYTSSQQIHVGILSPTIDDDDNRCLVDVNSRPRLIECSYAKAKRMKLHWQFSQVTAPEPPARATGVKSRWKVHRGPRVWGAGVTVTIGRLRLGANSRD